MTTQDRLMTACGPAGVALLLVGNSMAASDMPAVDASDRELQAYLTNLDPAWLGATLEVFGLVALLVFAVALSRQVKDSLVLAGGAAAVAVKLATALPLLAVWMRPEAIDPSVAGLALDLGTIGFTAGGALFALVPAAAAARELLPGWLRVCGAVTAVALLAQVPLMREEFGLGFLLFMLWTIATGVVLLRGRNLRAPAALQPA
jgi:hypothetical protein